MDFAYLTKKEPRTEASGDLLTEPQTKMKLQILNSNSEAKLEETPQIPTSSSHNPKKKKAESQQSPNSFPPLLANHPSNLDHWLEQWHKSHPQPPSQTAWWPEHWELEYPNEETPAVRKEYSRPFSPLNTVEEMEVEMTPMMWVEEVVAEVDLIQQVAQTQPTKGHYRTR